MFDKQSCIVCLEKSSSTEFQINMDSDEPQAIIAQEIIERYFKADLIMMSYFSTKIVCKTCWELLQSLHEFYGRVREAHLAASNTLKSLQELEIAVTEIKDEPVAIDELATSPQKRRRGRPRKPKQQIESDSDDEPLVALKMCTIRMDEKEDDVYDEDKPEVKNKELLPDIKTEETFAESMDREYTPPMPDSEEESNSSDEEFIPTAPPAIKPEKTNEEYIPKKKRKYTKRKLKEKRSELKTEQENGEGEKKQRHKTSDYDEFIAKNFALACCICHVSLPDFRTLKGHFRQQHKTNGYVKCCGKKLLKRGVLVDHIHFHNDPEYFKCEHCEKLMSDRRGLETHVQIFHGSRDRVYNCEICNKGFFRREVLARHALTHAPDEEKKVKCTQCDKTFCNKYGMTQHLKLVHLHLYAKICDICGKSFHGGDAFRRHQQEHSGLPRSLIKCELCDAELTTKYGLARHMKVMHTEEYQTPQVCPICSKVSPTLRAHLSHFKFVHTTQKKHACQLCDKAFKRPTDLREHMTTHTGEVLYTCTFCPQTFNSNANMYSHRKRKHPKEWAEKFAKKSTSTGLAQQIQNDLVSIIESVEAVETVEAK